LPLTDKENDRHEEGPTKMELFLIDHTKLFTVHSSASSRRFERIPA
jgi:hypothetical protein